MTTPANPTPEPTPLTDAQDFIAGHQDWEGYCVTAKFARDLEKQLADTRRRLAEAEKERDLWRKRAQEQYLNYMNGVGLIERINRRVQKVDYHDQGHVCDSRKAVEAIAQMIQSKAHANDYTALRNAADGLACAVGSAPHDKSCYWWPKHPRGEPGACTCWKHKALADYSALISEGNQPNNPSNSPTASRESQG